MYKQTANPATANVKTSPSNTPHLNHDDALMVAERFSELLTGYPHIPLCVRVFPDNKSQRKGRADNLVKRIGESFDFLSHYQEDGCGVFAVVNAGGHTDKSIDTIRAVFIDADNVPLPEDWHVEPHFLVMRDETHWHAYWLTTGMDKAQFTETQRRLAVHYGTDPSISNPSRVMRIPGFKHLKNPDDPKDVTLSELRSHGLPGSEQLRLTHEVVTEGLPDVPVYVKFSGRLDPMHDRPVCDLDLLHNIEQAEQFLSRHEPAFAGDYGNPHTYATACMVRDFGISEALCLQIIFHSEWNQNRCEPPWDIDELETIVENAYLYGENRPGCKRATLSLIRNFRNMTPMGLDEYEDWKEGWNREQEYLGEINKTARDKTARDKAAREESITEQDDGARPSNRRSFHPRSEAEQDARPDPEWLIDSVLQKETLALFYGPEDSYKSFLVLDMVLSAAAGRSWAGYGGKENAGGYVAKKPLTTVYVAGEGSSGIEKKRRPAWRKHYGITEPLPFYSVDEMPFFKSEDDVNRLISAIEGEEISPDIIVVDTAARAMHDLDENSAKDTGVFVDSCDHLKRHFRCTVVVVHHTGKDERRGARGSTNLPASFDARFKVTGDTDKLTATIKNEKQKDGEPWSEPISFNGEKIALGGEETSLVFGRAAPGLTAQRSKDVERISEVEAALNSVDGDQKTLATKVVAEAIIDKRLQKDPSIAEKADESSRDLMIKNETRNLQRQAKDKKDGKPGLLRQFVVGEPDSGDLLWTIPSEDA